MQQLKYFPFERNRYYYGKLLTEQDFVQEQQYMNDKRRLQNCFLHGAGVVGGMQVVMIDEKNISIEDGVALDFSGREIVVETPAMRRISALDGFESVMEQGKGNYAYLCISYEEQGVMPAHNVAVSRQTQEETFDKTKEGYHLYLTDREPENMDMMLQGLTRAKEVLYEDYQIRITQTVPLFATAGEEMEVIFEIINLSNAVRMTVSIEQRLEGALYHGKGNLFVIWENMILERGESQSKTVKIKAMDLFSGNVSFRVLPQNIKIEKEQETKYADCKKTISVALTRLDKMEAMKQRYFETKMESITRNQYPQGIYLAKLILLKTESSYLLEKVEPMPFRSYVYSTHLLAGMADILWEEMKALKNEKSGEERKSPSRPPESTEGSHLRTAQGSIQISLGVGGRREQRFFSHEIFHGLGLGPVQISLCIQEDDDFYFGSGEIFEDMEVKGELAAKLDAAKGSFVIGLRLVEPTQRQSVAVHWRAEASQKTDEAETEHHIYIVPGKLELKVRESYYLEAICENMPTATVLWRVTSQDGGSIAADGTYTAPNSAGVYEVVAQCQEVPSLKASLFVVVRE